MLKEILNFDGAQELSKNEQKSISGGMPGLRQCCDPELHCCTFAGSPSATGQCCTGYSWTPYSVCYSTGGVSGYECI